MIIFYKCINIKVAEQIVNPIINLLNSNFIQMNFSLIQMNSNLIQMNSNLIQMIF